MQLLATKMVTSLSKLYIPSAVNTIITRGLYFSTHFSEDHDGESTIAALAYFDLKNIQRVPALQVFWECGDITTNVFSPHLSVMRQKIA